MKAHICITGNEATDMFAKSGAGVVDISVHVQLLPRSVKKRIIQEILKYWQRRWKEETSGRCVSRILSKVSEKRSRIFPFINLAITENGLSPAYYRCFQSKPWLVRRC